MYIPSAFLETRTEVLHAFIRKHSFATLISHSESGVGISHLPMVLDEPGTKLIGHLARANPQWHDFANGASATAIFHGPHTYISPRWYTTRVAVPTWNYANVYASGRVTIIDDRTRLESVLQELASTFEATAPNAWSMKDLLPEMRDKMVNSIVGLELAIEKLEGKFKLNQNRPAADRVSVINALGKTGNGDDKAVAEIMKE